MFKALVYLSICLVSISSRAQEGVGSSALTQQATPGDAQQANNPMFKDGAGQNFSADQLANQLQNLRSAVDQTLPLLTAFNQNVSNAVGGKNQTVRDAISGILSGDKKNAQNPPPSAQSSLSLSNVVSTLESLLKKQHSGTIPANQNTVQDLEALQNSLQPVAKILQNLNVTGISTNQFARPAGGQ